MAMCDSKKKGIECMNDNLSRRRKKYAIALLTVTAATVGTSFLPSAQWVMASTTASSGPPSDVEVIVNEIAPDKSSGKVKVPYYYVQGGENVSVKENTFSTRDSAGKIKASFNNFIVNANDTIIEDNGNIVVDTDFS